MIFIKRLREAYAYARRRLWDGSYYFSPNTMMSRDFRFLLPRHWPPGQDEKRFSLASRRDALALYSADIMRLPRQEAFLYLCWLPSIFALARLKMASRALVYAHIMSARHCEALYFAHSSASPCSTKHYRATAGGVDLFTYL